MNDVQIQAQAYGYFLAEAPDLLQTIEQEILTLPSDRTTAKVHNLMRALHTLKGAAASVGLETIERIAHDFEDITRVFYNLDVEIDLSIQSLLLDGYSGLQECLDAQMMNRAIDEPAIAKRMTATIERLKLQLGDAVDAEVALPTAMELGFDIVASIFETTIQEQIDTLNSVIITKNVAQIRECLQSHAEVGIGLAESLELPGFLAIEEAIIAAIEHHPDRIESIAQLALENLQQAQAQVLAGDRTQGGDLLPDLAALAQNQSTAIAIPPTVESDRDPDLEADSQVALAGATVAAILPEIPSHQNSIVVAGEAELPAFIEFLTGDRFRKRYPLSADTQYLFDRVIHLAWDWFRHEIQTPPAELKLEVLVTAEGLADLDYIHHWIELLLQGVSTPGDRSSLQLYRQCCLYQVVFAVAKYLSILAPCHQITPDILTQLRLHLQTLADSYQQQPPVTANERGWLDRIIIPHHWAKTSTTIEEEDPLLSEIWGEIKFE